MNETMIEDEPQLVPLSCNLEFQRKNIWFSQSDVTSFYESRWTTNRVVVLAYRSVAFAYLLPWILYRVISLPDLPAFSHFTGWQFFIIILYFLVASCTSVHGLLFDGGTSKDNQSTDVATSGTRWFHSLTWMLQTVAFTFTIITFSIYWPLLYPYHLQKGIPMPVFNVHVHGITTLFMLVDAWLCKFPTRLLHFYAAYLVGIVYGFFTLVLHLAGLESAIYPFLDWENHSTLLVTVAPVLLLVAVMYGQACNFGFYKLREFYYRRTPTRGSGDLVQSEKYCQVTAQLQV